MKFGRVLLADRHPHMLEGMHGLMENLFDSVFMVADGASLLDAVERLKPDLMILDLSLPLSPGFALAGQISRRFPRVKVIALSIHDEWSVVEKVMSAGARGFVLKRSAGFDLIAAAKQVMKGKTYISPSLKQKERARGANLI